MILHLLVSFSCPLSLSDKYNLYLFWENAVSNRNSFSEHEGWSPSLVSPYYHIPKQLESNRFIISPMTWSEWFHMLSLSVKTRPYTCTRKCTLNGQFPLLYSFHLRTILCNFQGKRRQQRRQEKAAKMNPFNARTVQRIFLQLNCQLIVWKKL